MPILQQSLYYHSNATVEDTRKEKINIFFAIFFGSFWVLLQTLTSLFLSLSHLSFSF